MNKYDNLLFSCMFTVIFAVILILDFQNDWRRAEMRMTQNYSSLEILIRSQSDKAERFFWAHPTWNLLFFWINSHVADRV